MALLEKAAGQGHAYAMIVMGSILSARKEYEQTVKWLTKGAEAGCPAAMYSLGEAVQVEPIKPWLKAPGNKRLKLKYDKLLSSVAFNWNLRRYISGAISTLGRAWLRRTTRRRWIGTPARQTRVTVGRCRLTVSKPGLKAPMVSALETIIS